MNQKIVAICHYTQIDSASRETDMLIFDRLGVGISGKREFACHRRIAGHYGITFSLCGAKEVACCDQRANKSAKVSFELKHHGKTVEFLCCLRIPR